MGIMHEMIVHAAVNGVPKQGRLDFKKTRYDQSTFIGRYKYFFGICNPIRLFDSKDEIFKAQDIINQYKKGKKFPELKDEDIWNLNEKVESACHPVSEKLIPWFARMAAQCPVNTLLVGGMLIFYKSPKEVLFWQWCNQSYNAIVNQQNGSDPSGGIADVLKSYAMSVTLALTASIAINRVAARMSPLIQQLVPFASLTVSNAINIPISRQNELLNGIQLYHDEVPVTKSKRIAVLAISSVVVSRIVMSIPHMVLIPVIISKYQPFFKKYSKLEVPFKLVMCFSLLYWSVPLGCALFPQRTYISVDKVEPEVQEILKKAKKTPIKEVYYNKGL